MNKLSATKQRLTAQQAGLMEWGFVQTVNSNTLFSDIRRKGNISFFQLVYWGFYNPAKRYGEPYHK